MNKKIEGKKRKSGYLLHRTLSILSVIMLLGQIFTSLMTTVSALEEIVEDTGSLVVESSPPTASEPVIEIVSEEPETTPPIEPTQTSDTAETNVEPEPELSTEKDTPPSNEQSDSESESSLLEETARSNELSTDLPQEEESQDETPHVNSPISLTTMSSGITVTLTGPGTSFPEHHNDITLAVTTITDGRYQTAVSQLDALLPPLEQASRQTTILGLGLYQNGQAIQLQGAVTITFSGLSYQQAMYIHQVDGNGQLSSSGMSLSGQTAALTTSVLSSYSFTALNQPTIKIESEEASSETETESEETVGEVDDVQETEDNTSNNESAIEFDAEDETIDTSEQLSKDILIEPQMILPPETRAITYEFYVNGAKIDNQIILNGERVIEPASPTAERNFLGWYTDVGGVETLLDFATPIVVTEDSPADIVRVDAKFDNIFYVDFMQNGVVITTKEVQAGNQTDATGVPVVEDIEEGKAFSHWSTEPNGAAFDFAQAINQDVTLYAVNSERYKVTFDTVGGTQILPVYVQANSPINLASITPIKAGYSLNGWLLNGNSFNTDTPVSQNMTLTANWQAINQEYTVIYWHENANDTGDSFKEAITRVGITGSNATHQVKTYPGFTFDSVEQNVIIEGDGSTQLNVYYKRNTYLLTFRRRNNNNNWVNVITPVQVKHGASILTHWQNAINIAGSQYRWQDNADNNWQIEAPIMPMRNLTLNGEDDWNITATVIFIETGVNTEIKRTSFRSNANNIFNGGRELIGFTWQYVTRPGNSSESYTRRNNYTVSTYYSRNQYDIQFVTNNHTGAATIDVNDIYYEASIANVAPASYVVGTTSILIDGITYVFDGWYDNQVLAGSPFNFAGKTMPANNLVYYAKWVPKNFTVVNHYGDGVTKKNITITPNGTVQDKADELEKMDKTEDFAGWYWFVDGRYVPFDLNMPIKRDGIEIYPEWIGDVVNIKYDANGGENPPTDTRGYQLGVNAYARAIATMQRAGYRFIGWNTKFDGSGEAFQPYQKFLLTNELVGPESVLTLYAQWSKVDTTQLTYDSNYPDAEPEIVRTISNIQMNSLVSILAPEAGSLGITHTDYEFVGWNTARDGSGTSYQPTNSIRLNNPSTENILYAQWIKKINITVNKIWNDGDNQDGKRPLTLAVQLYANNQVHGSVVSLTPANNWTYTWTGLPEKSGNQTITYSVKEVMVPAGYQAVISPIVNGVINITNSYTPEVTKVEGTKTWNDNNNQDGVRPTELRIYLLADGVEVATQVITGEGNVWDYSFANLPVFHAGERIVYTVTEATIEGYSLTSTAGAADLINKRTPDERSVTVTKSWNDANNQDGKRPLTIEVQLLADGEAVGEVTTLTSAGDWTHTWTGLPVNAAGETITYTVAEPNVPEGYISTINSTDASNFVVTNSHDPEITMIEGTKTWDDANNQDGVRPTELRIYLLADGVEVATQVITGEGNVWDYSFANLPVFHAGERIVYTVTEATIEGYSLTSTAGAADLINTRTPDERSVTVTKSWNDANNQDGKRPLTIEVQLLADGEAVGEVTTLTSAGDWTHTWTGLPVNAAGETITYTVAEPNVPEGYISTINSTDASNIVVTNSHDPEITMIEGTKTWDDANNQDGVRPTELRIYLLADGVEVATQVITGEGNVWDYSFANLPVFHAGERIVYTVTEATIEGYSLTSTAGAADLINTRTPDERSVTVTKSWNDANNQDGKRPLTIEVQLLADGEAVGEVTTLTQAGDWTHTWTGLPVNAAGETITYTVAEPNVPEGYISTIKSTDASNIVVTNSHDPEITMIEGTKTWADANNQDGVRPTELRIYLLADGEEVATQVITGEGNVWDYSFANLPVFHAGERIVYTVTEATIEGYSLTSTAGAADLINTRTPDERSVTVTKSWDDANNQDGKRPLTIEVQLLADGEAVGEVTTLTQAGDWTHTWTGLPVNAAGETITYTVAEPNVPEGYISTIKSTDASNIVVTNSHDPEITMIEGTKTWADANNQDGVRPTELRIYLLADGEEVATQVITGEGNVWDYSFANLPVFHAGERIVYTVTEATIEGYSLTSTAGAADLINTRTPDERSVTVTKSWDDANNQDGKRPLTIEVQLLADGEAVGEVTTLTQAGDWTHTWTGLPVNAAGETITYTVAEPNVPEGYISTIKSTDASNIVVTNSHDPEITMIEGTKTWADANNQDGVRPTELRIYLLADGEEVATQVITGEGNVWDYSFANLPVFHAGERIVYTVTEATIEGYSLTSTAGAADLINTRTPDERSVTVTKSWDDANNQDGKRPLTIEVQLLADGEAVGEVTTLTPAGDWTHTWTGLPVNAAGETITYTVAEPNVPEGYISTINSTDASNIVVTNSHDPEITMIEGTKTWDDANNQDGVRPTELRIYLLADGVEIANQVITGEGNVWDYSFNELPVYRDGERITYTITEETVLGYTLTSRAGSPDLINTRTPDERSVTVTKAWLDSFDQDGLRPEAIEVQLLANGEIAGEAVTLTAATNWTYTWTGLPVNADGETITYTVAELNVPEGYTSNINVMDASNIIVTNSHQPEMITLNGEKVWVDNEDAFDYRPEAITVRLLQNGVTHATVEVTPDEAGNWNFSFDNLPKYFAQGELIDYRLEEVAVPRYVTEIDGTTITNTFINDETVTIAGQKVWNDYNDQFGHRPDMILVHLVQDGERIETLEVMPDSDGNWNYRFDEQLKFDETGREFTYTVEETEVPEYTTEIDGSTIINTYINTDTTALAGQKVWQDYENRFGTRPESITIHLLQNGQNIAEQVVTANAMDDWFYSFTDLAMYDETGAAFEYRIEEVAVEGYQTNYDGSTIINEYVNVETVTIQGEKIWMDDDNQAKLRPETIVVILMRNGETLQEAEINGTSDQWTFSFENLPKYDTMGDEYVYEIDEVAVEGYTTTIKDGNIINTLIEQPKPKPDPDPKDRLPETGEISLNQYVLTVITLGFILIALGRKRNKEAD